VHLELCNGCGICENICPSNSYRSFSGSRRRGISITPSEEARPR
jgi:ferredoxin-type protein NapG